MGGLFEGIGNFFHRIFGFSKKLDWIDIKNAGMHRHF